ncbi:hypothetical protein, partial [Prevotella histicola]|uniref:hypothetical protein n=1 Tax=Prevotella histicola TaxID=470565 RepID=UPI00241C2D18
KQSICVFNRRGYMLSNTSLRLNKQPIYVSSRPTYLTQDTTHQLNKQPNYLSNAIALHTNLQSFEH